MLAVIPAGGRAERFGGIHKDALPIGEGLTLFGATLLRAQAMGCTSFAVITSAEKAALHERLLAGTDAALIVSTGRGLWAAVRQSFALRAERSLLLLPDTVFAPVEPVPADKPATE